MLLVRASHDDAVAVLRLAGAGGAVGPTAASGWTCVWLLDDDGKERVEQLGFTTYLLADETLGGLTVEFKLSGAQPERFAWSDIRGQDQIDALSGALADLLGPARSWGELQDLLARGDLDAESLWEGLDGLFRLPELAGPEPDRSVVASRADPALVRLAAAIAGPTWILPVDGGWTVTIPADREDRAPDILAAAVSGAATRRDRTVVLWRQGEAFELQIWRGRKMDGAWTWAGGWETVITDPLAVETAMCEVAAAMRPELHRPSLRALLRQQRLDETAATSLIEVLGLPGRVAEALLGSQDPGRLPGAELLEEAAPREAVLAAMRSGWAGHGDICNRPLYLAYAIGTAVAALVCVAMTGLSIAVLATDGAVIDQAGVTTDDRLAVGVFAVLALVLTPTAIHRIRKARRSKRPERHIP